jgi:hypothetical protein
VCREGSSNPVLFSLAAKGSFDDSVVDSLMDLQNQIVSTLKDGEIDFDEENYSAPCFYWTMEEESSANSTSSHSPEDEGPVKILFQKWPLILEYCRVSAPKYRKIKFEPDLSPLHRDKTESLYSILLGTNESIPPGMKQPPLKQSKVKDSYLKPRRGRCEIQEEEKFVGENSVLFPDLAVLQSWNELFPNLNDNEDSASRIWFQENMKKRKREEEKLFQSNKKKTVSSSSSASLASQQNNTSNTNMVVRSRSFFSLSPSLPVPISYHHPASFSLKTRPSLKELFEKSDSPFSQIHPAFLSISSSASGGGTNKFQPAATTTTASQSRERPVNLMELALDSLEQSLQETETRNFSRLVELASRGRDERSFSDHCQKKKLFLEELLYRIYRYNEPKQSGRVIYQRSLSSSSSSSSHLLNNRVGIRCETPSSSSANNR